MEEYKIFLVEDDIIFLEMLKETLHEEGDYKIHAFHTGEECLNNIHLQPHIVVLDYYLNSKKADAKNGMEILKEINRRAPGTKVIILSGQEDASLVYNFNSEKAADYIIKDENAFDNIKHSIKEILEDIDE